MAQLVQLPAPPPPEEVTPTDLVGACVGFVVASLSIGGLPEALGLSPTQVGIILGLSATVAALVRHVVRLRFNKKP